MKKFMDLINKKYVLSIGNMRLLNVDTYDKLWEWSVEELDKFWASVWEFTGIISSQSWQNVLENVAMNEIPKWFVGSKLNYAQNILKYKDDRVALISTGEDSSISVRYTYKQLYDHVQKIAAGLRNANVNAGDVIVAYIPNCPEAVYALITDFRLWQCWQPHQLGLSGHQRLQILVLW
jgi:acetoacetyl-CoA synthetase